MKQVLRDVETRMVGAVDNFKNELGRLRTGRASLSLVDGLTVDYYGTQTPLSQVASLSVPDPTTIQIAPWEPKVLAEIEKVILKSNLGMTPNNDGKLIRLTVPQLTEERRREIVKIAHEAAETARNAVRKIRRDGNDSIKELENSKEISEDQMHDGMGEVQNLTDSYVGKIKDALDKKEKEILEV